MSKLGRILLGTIVWALAGSVFGALFSALSEIARIAHTNPWLGTTLSAGLAGAVTAAFFGAMPVALIGALLGVLLGISALILPLADTEPALLGAAALLVGLIAGSLIPRSAVLRSRPLGQALSGLLAGVITGLLVTGVQALGTATMDTSLTAGVGVAGVGLLYVLFSRSVVRRCKDRISQNIGSPLVAALVACTVSLALWLLGTMAGVAPDSPLLAQLQQVISVVPTGLMGGAIAGAVGGALLEMLGIRLGAYHL
jgi:hypothetical protein